MAAELERWLVEDMGWRSLGLIPSPIAGGDGNSEFLLGAQAMSTGIVTIDRLPPRRRHRSDGSWPRLAPFTLPGETVSLAVNKASGTLISLKEASPERVEPPCRHFGPDGVNGTCGGCTLQHASDALYHAFKRNLVIDALRSKGTDAGSRPADHRAARRSPPLRFSPPGGRKRNCLLGYNQNAEPSYRFDRRMSDHQPGIVSRLATIRKIATAMASSAEPFRITRASKPIRASISPSRG